MEHAVGTKTVREEFRSEGRDVSIDIICTIGPASHQPDILRQLIEHGMTVARMNLSHADHQSHQQVIQNVREVSKKLGKKVKILGDLQGPKIRLGVIPEGQVTLVKGDFFKLHTKPVPGNRFEASVDYPGIVHDVTPGSRILINDGAVKLIVTKVTGEYLETEVAVGGPIASHKGVNLPGTRLNLPAMTEKDKRDLRFLLLEKVDFVACSFIREAANIDEIRAFSGVARGHIPQFIAKIETLEGLRNFATIVTAADGIMVARGDLGVEVPFIWIPVLQKAIIRECKRAASYCIVATQMLQSMTEQPIPTRAEVTDIFQAVLDGANAVMLSAESAAGKFPVQSADTLATVAAFAERAAREEPFDLADMIELLSGRYGASD
jgi:pyruvate kinase